MLHMTRRILAVAGALVLVGSIWTSEARARVFVPRRVNVTRFRPALVRPPFRRAPVVVPGGLNVQTYSVPLSRWYDPFGINQRNAYITGLYGAPCLRCRRTP